VLDSEFDFRGKSDRQIHEAVIQTIHGDSLELGERTDAYVEARFDAVIDLAERQDSSQPLRESIGAALRQDSGMKGGDKAKEARKQYLQNLEDSWKAPARKSKGVN